MKKFTTLLILIIMNLSTNVFAQNTGKALSLDGKDDFVNCGNNKKFDNLTYTLSSFIKICDFDKVIVEY